jgi:hypothetical protein
VREKKELLKEEREGEGEGVRQNSQKIPTKNVGKRRALYADGVNAQLRLSNPDGMRWRGRKSKTDTTFSARLSRTREPAGGNVGRLRCRDEKKKEERKKKK